MLTLRAGSFTRLLTTARSADGYVHTGGARYESTAAMLAAGLAIAELGVYRGACVKIIGKGDADNAVVNCRVYRARRAFGKNSLRPASSGDGDAHIDLEYFGLLVATLANTRGGVSGSSVQGLTELAADGMTWALATEATTPKGPATLLVAAHGGTNTPSVYTPADGNDDAQLLIPDAFDADALVFDLDRHTNATESNVLAALTR